jgi:hypothetical protein
VFVFHKTCAKWPASATYKVVTNERADTLVKALDPSQRATWSQWVTANAEDIAKRSRPPVRKSLTTTAAPVIAGPSVAQPAPGPAIVAGVGMHRYADLFDEDDSFDDIATRNVSSRPSRSPPLPSLSSPLPPSSLPRPELTTTSQPALSRRFSGTASTPRRPPPTRLSPQHSVSSWGGISSGDV